MRTVKSYRAHLQRKTSRTTRVELLAYALVGGMILVVILSGVLSVGNRLGALPRAYLW